MIQTPPEYLFESLLDRIQQASDLRTPMELVELLGIRQSAMEQARKTDAIPAEWLLKLLRLKRINPDWILTGEDPRYLVPSDSSTAGIQVAYLEHFHFENALRSRATRGSAATPE